MYYRKHTYSSLNKSKYICVKSCFMRLIINILINCIREKADFLLALFKK